MPTVKKPAVKARTKSRVEDTEPRGSTTKGARHREAGSGGLIEQLEEGRYFVSYQASELVPVAQFANVTIGPIQVATITNGDGEAAAEALEGIGEIVKDLMERDRAMVEESVRLYNERKAEEEGRTSKRS